MIEELLLALSGYPGDLFYSPSVSESNPEYRENSRWTIAPELIDFLHPGESEFLSQILLLPAYVIDFEKFIESYGPAAFHRHIIEISAQKIQHSDNGHLQLLGVYGASLGQGFSTILADYRSRLIVLEKILSDYNNSDRKRPSSSLSRIFADLQPYFRVFPILDKLRMAFNENTQLHNGGEILPFLCTVYDMECVDPAVKMNLEQLLRRCIQPFKNHLMNWLATGELNNDQFKEFFIQETAEKGQYVIRKDYLPRFVKETVAEKILFIGKSVKLISDTTSLDGWESDLESLASLLNAFLVENSDINTPSLRYDDLAFDLEKNIEKIRRFAAERLYVHCFEASKASGALDAWVKNGFFLGKGELFLAFIDSGKKALSAEISANDRLDKYGYQLTSSWSGAIGRIYWQNDDEHQYFDKITPYVATNLLVNGKKKLAWSLIRLKLDVPQHLASIFTAEFIADLNHIFRYLLRWRRTQSSIESCWFALNKLPPKDSRRLPNLDKIHQLTSLMLCVVKNLQYYLQVDVLESVYAETIKDISASRDFEYVLKVLHVNMINQIFGHCFIKRPTSDGDGMYSHIGKILANFGDDCDKFSALILDRLNDDTNRTNTVEIDRAFATKIHESYVSYQRNTALLFKILTSSKVAESHARLGHLLLRLDFNKYFSSTQLFSA